MPTFEYIALDTRGKQSRGSIAAESSSAARRLLRTRQLHATRLRPISEAARARRFEWRQIFKSRRRRVVLDFTRQMATMIDAEIKLTEALGVLIGQSQDAKLSQVIQNIRDQVISGESLADGLKQYPEWFDPIYVSMVRVGEVTGNLGRSLKLLGAYMSKRTRLEAKVKAALTYPAFLVVVCIIVIVILMTFVVPRITRIIAESGNTVPAITTFLMNSSDLLVNWWWLFLLGFFGGIYLIRRLLGGKKGHLFLDRTVLKIPVIGEILRQNIVARFTSTLAALMRSGMPMSDALKVVSDVTGNAVMTQAINQARERIIAGADIATPLRNSQVVDPATAHMIAVGERAGELESMLVTISETLEENTDITVQRISSVIEPCVIVIMAVIVAFIVFGTMWPILQLSNIKT
jgi:type II secretory pathway component PulF